MAASATLCRLEARPVLAATRPPLPEIRPSPSRRPSLAFRVGAGGLAWAASRLRAASSVCFFSIS